MMQHVQKKFWKKQGSEHGKAGKEIVKGVVIQHKLLVLACQSSQAIQFVNGWSTYLIKNSLFINLRLTM